MIPNLNNKQTGLRRFAIFALLLGLFLSQSYLAAHSADFDAHDSELCEICLGFNSPNDPQALDANSGFAFSNVKHTFSHYRNTPAVVSIAVSCQAIRAPPSTVTS